MIPLIIRGKDKLFRHLEKIQTRSGPQMKGLVQKLIFPCHDLLASMFSI